MARREAEDEDGKDDKAERTRVTRRIDTSRAQIGVCTRWQRVAGRVRLGPTPSSLASKFLEVALDLLKVRATSVSQYFTVLTSQNSGSELPMSLLKEVVASYAVVGDVSTERFLVTYGGSPPEPLRYRARPYTYAI